MKKTSYKKSAKYHDLFMKNVYRKNPEILYNFLDFIFNKHAKIKVRNILDIGCGTGIDSIYLKEKGFSVVGIDISKEMISFAEKKANKKNLDIQFIISSMENFIYDSEYDAIMNFGAFGHILADNAIENTLHKIHSALKAGGIFMLYQENIITISKSNFDRTEIFSDNENDFRVTVTYIVDELNCLITEKQSVVITRNGIIIDSFDEYHIFRGWTYNEGRLWLRNAGFSEIYCYSSLSDRKELVGKELGLIFCCVK